MQSGIASKIIVGLFLCVVVFVAVVVVNPTAAMAAPISCPDGTQAVSIAVPDPANPGETTQCIPTTSNTVQTNPIVAFLKMLLQFLAVGLGLAIVGGFAAGGIVYSTARGNAQQVQKAEEILRNTIIAVVLFIFTFTIVNFLIPGGLLI